jgi:hypothetical protein
MMRNLCLWLSGGRLPSHKQRKGREIAQRLFWATTTIQGTLGPKRSARALGSPATPPTLLHLRITEAVRHCKFKCLSGLVVRGQRNLLQIPNPAGRCHHRNYLPAVLRFVGLSSKVPIKQLMHINSYTRWHQQQGVESQKTPRNRRFHRKPSTSPLCLVFSTLTLPLFAPLAWQVHCLIMRIAFGP